MTDLFEPNVAWEPSRAEGSRRIRAFAPKSARSYAARRNYDLGPGRHSAVSCLSPYLRHRLVTEAEVVAQVLGHHTYDAAEKFIQEVFWRSYFKGWLEQRPSVWERYRRDRDRLLSETGLDYDAATGGKTGIDCFDHWVTELVETGYLHNHARMWFASIWIFTLRLPWQLGADFFMQHLMDGDPASNTCSWRWVGGLHTRGKTYLARADNIARYTDGAFRPTGLARFAPPLEESQDNPRQPLPTRAQLPDGAFVLLRTEDDLLADAPEWTERADDDAAVITVSARSPKPIGQPAAQFARRAAASAAPRVLAIDDVQDWAAGRPIVSGHIPVGPAQDAFAAAGLRPIGMLRSWDEFAWPHAKAGFFGLKKRIPQVLADIQATSS